MSSSYGITCDSLIINSGSLAVVADNMNAGGIHINGGNVIVRCSNPSVEEGQSSQFTLKTAPVLPGNDTAQSSTSYDGSNLVTYVPANNSTYKYFEYNHTCANCLTKNKVEPGCMTTGTEEYYTCSCGKLYADATATREITAPTVILALGHSFSKDWSFDATNHWHAATCEHSTEVKDKAAHVFGDDTICDICGYDSKPFVPGKVSMENSVSNSYSGKVSDETDVLNKVVTEEDRARTEDGLNVNIIFTVEDISNTISDEDKALIESNLGDNEQGIYLDISLFKQIGNDPPQKVTKTNGKIKVSISLPPSLISQDSSVPRTYKIIRIHEGEVTILDAIYDPATGLLTFETDSFSTYAVVYNDATTNTTPTTEPTTKPSADPTTQPNKEKPTDQKDDVPKTGDEGVTYIWLIIVTASVIGLALTLGLYLKRYRTRVNKE